MSDPIILFLIWFVVFCCLSFITIVASRGKYVAIFLLFCLCAFNAVTMRYQLYTPIPDLPPKQIEFLYNFHKLKTEKDQKVYIVLGISRTSDNKELIYQFPYIGNEKVKEGLDKLKKGIVEQTSGVGPYVLDKTSKQQGTLGPIIKSHEIYERLKKRVEQQ